MAIVDGNDIGQQLGWVRLGWEENRRDKKVDLRVVTGKII